MQFSQRRPDQTEERILPLINVVFLLLIFFMIAGSLSTTEPLEVAPPVSQSQAPLVPDEVTILMSSDGRLAMQNETLAEAEMLQQLETLLQAQPQARINLKADGELAANRLVRLTQSLYDIGVEKLQLVTVPEDA
jgi:biopolymer transport protein ExbD